MNALLHSSTLTATGSSNLCAVRFSSPVRVHKIRIYPIESPSLNLDVYFNCQLVPSSEEPKPKATNALVPTCIVHQGDIRDYYVDMTPQYTTKLMIIRGIADSLRISVYGAIHVPSSPPTTYTPRADTSKPSSSPLPDYLDPARSDDPARLGQDLLALTFEPPTLALVVKFALCHDLHEENGPDAPQLYTDMKDCLESLELGLDWIRLAAETTRRPISEHVGTDVLKNFAERVQDSLYDKHEDQGLLLSQLLYNTACQSSSVVELFTSTWKTEVIFEIFAASVTKAILQNLFMGSASRDIALYLRKGDFLSTITDDVLSKQHSSFEMKKLARDLLARVEGWERLGDPNTVDYAFFVPWLQSIISHEASLGIFLLSIFSSPVLLANFLDLPSLVLASNALGFSDLRLLGRAMVGVGSVLAALAWADAADQSVAATRTLSVLRLWQARAGPEDYGALVRSCLLLPRLFNMIYALSTSPAADAVLAALLDDKASALHPHVWEDREDELANLVLDGLPAALHILCSGRIEDVGPRQVLFALEIVRNGLEEQGTFALRKTAWEEGEHGLEYSLIDILISSTHALAPNTSQPASALLFDTAATALNILPALLEPFTLPARATRDLVRALATLVTRARMVQTRYKALLSVSHDAIATAYVVMRTLSSVSAATKPALRALAEALIPETDADDPVLRLEAIADLLNALLSSVKSPAGWAGDVALPVLTELSILVGSLAPQSKARVIRQLVDLDADSVGIADWILAEEVRKLERAAALLDAEHEDDSTGEVDSLVRAQAGLALECVACIAAEVGDRVVWDEPALARALVVLIDADFISADGPAVRAARALVPREQTLQFAAALVLLRDGEDGISRAATLLQMIAGGAEPDPPHLAKLSLRVGCALSGLRGQNNISESTGEAVCTLLQWMLDRHNDFEPFVLLGISEQDFSTLVELLPGSSSSLADAMRSQMRFSSRSAHASAAPDLLAPLKLTPSTLAAALSDPRPQPLQTPSTPPPTLRNTAAALLEFATVSPPASLLRSPQVTGLTKTYQNNDFRQLRSVPAGRVNTSRLPSLHVDDFENASQGSAASPTGPSPQPVHSNPAIVAPQGYMRGGHSGAYTGAQSQF